MQYFVTGATGFIGRFLVAELLKRPQARVYALVRAGSEAKLEQVRKQLGASPDQLIAVQGDLTRPRLGLSTDAIAGLDGSIAHFFHLAAIYDLKAPAEPQHRTNVDGTRHAIEAAEAMRAGCFHHVSSIAAAGLYPGRFTEQMFDEAVGLDDPYFFTKHVSEGLVRTECRIPFRIYRPSMVVGDAQTGEMDKIDGPYYIFKVLKMVGRWVPRWLPLPGIEGGEFNIVPVDYVVKAMDHIAHQDGWDGKCFHLTAERSHKLGELLDLVAKTGNTARFRYQISNKILQKGPSQVAARLYALPAVRRNVEKVLDFFGLPLSMLGFITYPVTFDRSNTAAALANSDIYPPKFDDYISTVWRFWRDHLDDGA